MHVFHSYHFYLPTKVRFSTLPEIAQQFFAEQNLCYDKFHYLLFDFKHPRDPSVCERAIAKFPELGQVEAIEDPRGLSYLDAHILSNMYGQPGCTEKEFIPLLAKFYRRFSFNNIQVIYQDINFFGQVIPAANYPQPVYFHQNPFLGSSLTLYRDNLTGRGNRIDLSIEVLRDGQTVDDTPYRDGLAKLLPGVKYTTTTNIRFTPEEEKLYAEKNESAQPLLQQAQDFFTQKAAEWLPPPSVKRKKGALSPLLKKLCKKYGFTYVRYYDFMYLMEKRTTNGHYITIEIEAETIRDKDGIFVSLKGVGVNLRIFFFDWISYDPTATADFYDRLFTTVNEAEQTVLRPLAEHFPTTPTWYIPSHY